MEEGNLTPEDVKFLVSSLVETAKKLDHVIIDLNDITRIKHADDQSKEDVCFSTLVNIIIATLYNPNNSDEVNIITDFSEIDNFRTIYNYSTAFSTTSSPIALNTKKPKNSSLAVSKANWPQEAWN
jgi:hypothetical protein